MNHKYKFGDIVYVKAFNNIGPEIGQILRYEESKGMYILITFVEVLDPKIAWTWCYIKEEDIDLLSNIEIDNGYDKHSPYYPSDLELLPSKQSDMYTLIYDLCMKVQTGEIDRSDYYNHLHSFMGLTEEIRNYLIPLLKELDVEYMETKFLFFIHTDKLKISAKEFSSIAYEKYNVLATPEALYDNCLNLNIYASYSLKQIKSFMDLFREYMK